MGSRFRNQLTIKSPLLPPHVTRCCLEMASPVFGRARLWVDAAPSLSPSPPLRIFALCCISMKPLDCCLESPGLWFLYRGDLSLPHSNADCLCPLQKSSLFNEDSCGNIERAWVFSELKLLCYDEKMKEATVPPFQLFYRIPGFNFVLMHRAKGMLMESPFPLSILHGYL